MVYLDFIMYLNIIYSQMNSTLRKKTEQFMISTNSVYERGAGVYGCWIEERRFVVVRAHVAAMDGQVCYEL